MQSRLRGSLQLGITWTLFFYLVKEIMVKCAYYEIFFPTKDQDNTYNVILQVTADNIYQLNLICQNNNLVTILHIHLNLNWDIISYPNMLLTSELKLLDIVEKMPDSAVWGCCAPRDCGAPGDNRPPCCWWWAGPRWNNGCCGRDGR